MTTLTVEVEDSDIDIVLTTLKQYKTKIIEVAKPSPLTLEIMEALSEVKQMREGKIESLTLKDI